MLVSSYGTVENLESSVTDLDLRRDKCKADLRNHYDRVMEMLDQVYKSSLEDLSTQYEKKKEGLNRKQKSVTRCSVALMAELGNLKSGGTEGAAAVRRCEEILDKLTKVVDLQNIETSVKFDFIPNIGKLKLGFLQLCNNLPADFTLSLLTPIVDITIGQQILCGIEGDFNVENVRHLEFGIRRDNDIVPLVNLGTRGKVFKFGFKAEFGGEYMILACLFGNPIAHSPLTITIGASGAASSNPVFLGSHIEDEGLSNSIGAQILENAEEDDGKIPAPVKDTESRKASTEVVEGNRIKSSIQSKDALPQKQVTDVHNVEVDNVNNDFPDKRFKVGDSCVALGHDGMWYNGRIEDFISDGSCHIKFVDYGLFEKIAVTDIVKSAPDIPVEVPDYDVDDNVGSRTAKHATKGTTFKKNEGSTNSREYLDSNQNVSEIKKPASKLDLHFEENKGLEEGDSCLAQWSEDKVWYNGIVQAVNKDGSYSVTFTDYGNYDLVKEPFIVKQASKIPTRDYIDVNVNNHPTENNDNEISETFLQSTLSQENVDKNFSSGDSNRVSGQDKSSKQTERVPFVLKTVRPDRTERFEEKNQTKDSKATTDYKGSLASVKTTERVNETVNKRRSKSKPPVPRPLVSNYAPILPKSEEKGWKEGDICLAQWSEDSVWYNAVIDNKKRQFSDEGFFQVTYNVTFTDYGNQDQVRASQIVKDHNDLVQIGVDAIFDENVKIDLNNRDDANRLWTIGETCLAKDRNGVWRNATIVELNAKGLFTIHFSDYKNRKAEVDLQSLVKSLKDIPNINQQIIDENVKFKSNNKELSVNSNSPSHFPLPNTSSNTPVESSKEFVYPDVVEGEDLHSSKDVTEGSSLSKTFSYGSTFSGGSQAFKTEKANKLKPINILEHVTKTKDGSQEIILKCIFKVGREELLHPVGMTVFPNKNIIVGSNDTNVAKILGRDGTVLGQINSVRQFLNPTDVTILSNGEFVVRDDEGLQLFKEGGAYVKPLGAKEMDKYFGLSEDEEGNIITINWVQPSFSSRPGSKGKGGLTEVGETDVFFINKESGEVVKKVGLTDIFSDKTESKCRFLNYHSNTLYIVDTGLDCVYKLKTDSNQVSVVGGTGTGPGKFRHPTGVVVDDLGNMIVADSKNHRLQIIDREENFVGVVVTDIPVRRPSGIFLDKQVGELYVLNYWGTFSMVKYRISC